MPNVSIFEDTLTGGHHNSLGNTLVVADQVNADHSLLPDLIATYASDDEVVRLRVSFRTSLPPTLVTMRSCVCGFPVLSSGLRGSTPSGFTQRSAPS